MKVVHPDEQPRTYTTALSHLTLELPGDPMRYSSVPHLTLELPGDPMRYSSVPDALPGHGIWAAAGFNTANVGMSATETITSNERVLGADPLVEYVPATGVEGEEGYTPAVPGVLGEEYFVIDVDDATDEEADAYEEYVADLMDLIADVREGMLSGEIFNPREAFGSHSDSDHVYNTPRAWYMQRCPNHHDGWVGHYAHFTPESDDIPWCRAPERKVTIDERHRLLR